MKKIKYHNSLAIGQCRRRWLIDSPSLVHIQHRSSTTSWCFQRLLVVKTFSNDVVQRKKAILSMDFWLPHTLPREKLVSRWKENLIERVDFKLLLRRWRPTYSKDMFKVFKSSNRTDFQTVSSNMFKRHALTFSNHQTNSLLLN